ncbi:hypothetical protein [Pontibacter liquoris]|uniref:hypothetical protein n=1 Tax=Pontibacter liquoris TaxID=2905677 RepID=UPI001FA7A19C|nr:hypothetical protein [Pontibacter liquoris]
MKLTCSAVAFAALIAFSGCQKEDVNPEREEAVLAVDEQGGAITDVNGLENPIITGASESTAFGVNTTDTRPESYRLTYILKRLNLNEGQRTAVRRFVEAYEVCVAEHRSKVQQYHEELLKRANAIREEHISAYRAGAITKQELDQRLANLHKKLEEEIKKHPGRQMHVRIMHRCRMELFSKVESVLGPEQLKRWEQWKSRL